MKQDAMVITIVVGVIAAGAGFFGGIKYQQMQVTSLRGNGNFVFRGGPAGAGARNGQGGNRGGGVIGDIISADDKSITVKLQDGSSKIVIVSGTTSINQATQATKADLKVGERVAAFGTTNPDGSTTAQNIQINPAMRNFGGNGNATNSANQ